MSTQETTMAEYTTKAGASVTVRHDADEELVIVACSACGVWDSIDYGPFERRTGDYDSAVDEAEQIAAEHAQTCEKAIEA